MSLYDGLQPVPGIVGATHNLRLKKYLSLPQITLDMSLNVPDLFEPCPITIENIASALLLIINSSAYTVVPVAVAFLIAVCT